MWLDAPIACIVLSRRFILFCNKCNMHAQVYLNWYSHHSRWCFLWSAEFLFFLPFWCLVNTCLYTKQSLRRMNKPDLQFKPIFMILKERSSSRDIQTFNITHNIYWHVMFAIKSRNFVLQIFVCFYQFLFSINVYIMSVISSSIFDIKLSI